MSRAARPPIWQSVIKAYQDSIQAVTAMPLVAVAAFAIGLVDAVFTAFFFRDENGETYFSLLVTASLLWSLLYTPVLIAVHRFILLGVVTNQYRVDANPRFLRFFAWSFYVNVLYILSLSLFGLLADASAVAMLAGVVTLLVAIYLTLRLVTLFPAIAIESTRTSWRDAYRDTKGYAPRILATFVIASSPLIGINVVVSALRDADTPEAEFNTFNVTEAVIDGAMSGLLAVICVAIASRFYEWMGNRVNLGSENP